MKRLTLNERCDQLATSDFNSQPHEEADYVELFAFTVHQYFNSQPHEEADRRNPQSSHLPEYFNSQPHEEADEHRR